MLYETLTGQRAFPGETIQDTSASVLVHEPDWRMLPAGTPESVVKLLRRCLEKDPGRRLHDIADARLELEDAVGSPLTAAPKTRGRLTFPVLAVVAVVAVAVAVWGQLRPADPAPAQTVRRLLIGLPGARPLAQAVSMPLGDGQPSFAISPDGTRIAYVLEVQGTRQLYVHELDELEGVPITRTDGAFGPFFSPNGRWIGFFAENRVKKVAVSGGTPIDLAAASNPYGGSWGDDGTILFAADEGRRPLRIRDTGGVPERLPIKDERGSWRQPDILPGGKAAIVTNPVLGVGVLSLETGEYRELLEGFSGRYASSGHIVFARAGALLAAPFDLERLTVSGPSTVILEGIRIEGQPPLAHAAYSRDGTLVYVPGNPGKNATRPVWVDRQGKVVPVDMPPRSYRAFNLSPDGRQLAIQISDPDDDLWVQDLERGTLMRLTSGGNNIRPSWTPDGTRVVFARQTNGGAARAFWVSADGSVEPEPMFKVDQLGTVASFSPKGDVVTVQKRSPDTGLDLWVRPLRGDQTDRPFLRTPFTEVGSKFSPDGRWIAYTSDESGQSEVYVRAYPGPGGKWQVSTLGGGEGVWSRDGKELFYRNGNKWMVVPVTSQPEFKAGTPRLLFEGSYVNVGGFSYNVSPDGRRFLLFQAAEEAAGPVRHLNVVLNWFEDVKRKAGLGPTVAQR